MVPLDSRPGIVYEIMCGCHASYIGETGNTLSHRFREHMGYVTRYKNAEQGLNESHTVRRGRAQTRTPRKIMEEAIKASAVAEHAIHCSLDPRPNVICRENRFQLRRIKEALFIRHNRTINRDKGVKISEEVLWRPLILCAENPGGAPLDENISKQS
uniref:GIY-YIG domain-containing protein n=1 Tax=Trichuris muris TaxID=70415 RepID=A0A5S6QCP1_TRIMR